MAPADVADDLAQMRFGLKEGSSINDEPFHQRTVALQQLVGEFHHPRVGPGVLAQIEDPEERRFLLARRNFIGMWEEESFEIDFSFEYVFMRKTFLCNSPESVQFAFSVKNDSFARISASGK